jgi:hypothetical protein
MGISAPGEGRVCRQSVGTDHRVMPPEELIVLVDGSAPP